jgi:hypothetical protein
MRTLVQDLTFGLASELRIKPLLEKEFNDALDKTDTFHPMDYVGTACWVEIKTRTCSFMTYSTTMLPYSKIVFTKDSKKPVYFVFVFTDGVYYIQYDEKLFNTFYMTAFQRTGRDKIDTEQVYVYIPCNKLIKIE